MLGLGSGVEGFDVTVDLQRPSRPRLGVLAQGGAAGRARPRLDADCYLVVTGDGIVGALDALVQRALAVEF